MSDNLTITIDDLRGVLSALDWIVNPNHVEDVVYAARRAALAHRNADADADMFDIPAVEPFTTRPQTPERTAVLYAMLRVLTQGRSQWARMVGCDLRPAAPECSWVQLGDVNDQDHGPVHLITLDVLDDGLNIVEHATEVATGGECRVQLTNTATGGVLYVSRLQRETIVGYLADPKNARPELIDVLTVVQCALFGNRIYDSV